MDVIIPGAPLMAQSLGGAAVIDFGIQLVGWAFAAALKTEKFYDLCGSLAFASTAAMTYASSARLPRQGLITGLVCTWTARLGMLLVRRVFRDGGDSRFDEVKNQPGTFLVYWMLQGAWVWVTALPCFLVNGVASQSALHWGDYVSMALWIVGYGAVQAAAPRLLGARETTVARTVVQVRLWAAILTLIPAGLALAAALAGAPAGWLTAVLVAGLLVFGGVFAINSALHSFLVLAYAQAEHVTKDVGFYYMSNAAGRLAGTLLSGVSYQLGGLWLCLATAAVMCAMSRVLAGRLPETAPG